MEPQAKRVGVNGRATQIGPTDLAEKLGDVYDTRGELVYDKDYISQQDDDDLSSVRIDSQNSGEKSKSRSASFNNPSKLNTKQSKPSSNMHSGA